MKNKTVLIVIVILIVAAIGFLFCGSDDKNSIAPSVSDASVHEITLDDDVRDAGLRIGRVLVGDGKNTATVYAQFIAHFSADVILKAFDRTGNEIGRAKRLLSGDVDDAAYFDFVYDSRVPMKTASYFVLSFATKKSAPEVPSEVVSVTEEESIETAVPMPISPDQGEAESIPEAEEKSAE